MIKKPKMNYTAEQLAYFQAMGMRGGLTTALRSTQAEINAKMAKARTAKLAKAQSSNQKPPIDTNNE
mgnify:CR=1 FL=1